ncbi:hypothetical protein [Lysobacter sp. Root667]|uniref:hypothetical protein n=1 Tax=Lysobacter sp. Root667 TaxID=1736581 RepID=UPI0012DFE42E|nr:hypothetical protein [Lysobacter sp. Root667]
MHKVAAFLSLSMMTMSCAAQDKVVANPSYSLSDQEVATLSNQAYEGSAVAAMRLSDRYFYDLSKGQRSKMQDKALVWALIGAENDGPQAQFRAYQLLGTSSERAKWVRALFWLKKSAGSGDADAQRELRVCSTLESKRPSGTSCFGPEEP